MAVLVGIDEAGYGPLLGPMVLSSATMSLSDELLKADLWQVLNKSVAKQKKGLAGRIHIADSKKVYSKKKGIKNLERSVLASLKNISITGNHFGEIFGQLCSVCNDRIAETNYPWYQNLESIGLDCSDDDVSVASAFLSKDMKDCGIGLEGVSSITLDVAHYNKMLDVVKNKASVSFTSICTLILEAYKKYGDDNLQIIVDRQGGRTHYARVLQRMFEELEITILKEDEKNSSYELGDGKRKMRIHFHIKADDKFMPVALASMVSKYVRERMMGFVNKFFIGHCSEIKPTAGYWQDGLRFVADIEKLLPDFEYDKDMFVRKK